MRYATCADQHYDAQAGTCAQVVWTDQPSSFLPPMTTDEGMEIALAVVGVLTIAVVIKFAIRIGTAVSNP